MNPGTRTRLIAGLSGLAVLLPAVIWGGLLAVQIIVVLATLICLREYANMAFPDDADVASGWLLGGLVAVYVGSVHLPQYLVQIATLLTLATFVFVTLRPGEELARAADRMGRYVLGFAWLGMLTLLVKLRALDDGLILCFIVLAISWLGDTGAYFAGRAFGKRKLYERISPNKSVEGAIGGLVSSTLGVFGFAWLGLPAATPVDCVLLGVVGSACGVLGDLSESMLKRAFGVKDAGSIMPGHGGLLDRIDSVLFVGVWVYAYATLVMRVP